MKCVCVNSNNHIPAYVTFDRKILSHQRRCILGNDCLILREVLANEFVMKYLRSEVRICMECKPEYLFSNFRARIIISKTYVSPPHTHTQNQMVLTFSTRLLSNAKLSWKSFLIVFRSALFLYASLDDQ